MLLSLLVVSVQAVAQPAPTLSPHAITALSSPQWTSLSKQQHLALSPLGKTWDTLSEGQRRKWLAIAKSYQELTPAEQEKMHSRMVEWAALSPKDRELARLNFAQTKSVTKTDRAANWEAYQALSPEERQKLADSAKVKPVGAAVALKPVSPDKLAAVPVTRHTPAEERASAAAQQPPLNRSTLLPQPLAKAQTPATAQTLLNLDGAGTTAPNGLLGIRRHSAIRCLLHFGLPVWNFEPDTQCTGQSQCLAGVSLCHFRHLLCLVLGQRPNTGHEDMAYPVGRPSWQGRYATARPGALCAELDLVSSPAAECVTFWTSRRRSVSARNRLDRRLGTTQSLSSRAPVLARHLGWHTIGRSGVARPLNGSSPAMPLEQSEPVNPQKQRKGLSRILHAGGYSIAGLRAAWHETAFKQEALLSLVLLPTSFWLGNNWLETAALSGSILAVMVVELLNTALESAIDRIGPEWHDLSKRAKDLGSAAVLLSLIWCAGVWAAALYRHFQ